MRPISWETYYSRFYDWANSTQAMYVSCLTSLGPAREVAVIIGELQYTDIKASNRLLKMAVDAKIMFSCDELTDFFYFNDKDIAKAALTNSAEKLSGEDMENLYMLADDDELIVRLCRTHHIPIPIALREEERHDTAFTEPVPEKPERMGFMGFMSALFAAGRVVKSAAQETDTDWLGTRRGHNGKCDGDCAHCPPHYGYRYGRWYYGHDHIEGCEFGGNKGGGGI